MKSRNPGLRDPARPVRLHLITSGSPPLVNFAQTGLRKRVTIFGIHDQ
jgi:hypothetical protein